MWCTILPSFCALRNLYKHSSMLLLHICIICLYSGANWAWFGETCIIFFPHNILKIIGNIGAWLKEEKRRSEKILGVVQPQATQRWGEEERGILVSPTCLTWLVWIVSSKIWNFQYCIGFGSISSQSVSFISYTI